MKLMNQTQDVTMNKNDDNKESDVDGDAKDREQAARDKRIACLFFPFAQSVISFLQFYSDFITNVFQIRS
uniref:Uncharacterized protein n=1 Tax=Arion vulgaris TaxID=1028688 RepID=A0A0B7AH38_9EUPU